MTPTTRRLCSIALCVAASRPASAFAEVTGQDHATADERPPPPAPVALPARVLPDPVLVPVTEPDRREAVRPWQRPVGIAVTGAGVLGVGFGAFFGLRAHSKWSSAEPNCPSTGCTAAGYQSWQDARSAATASTILFVTGGALLAAGVVIWVTAPSAPVDLHVGFGGDRLQLGGAF